MIVAVVILAVTVIAAFVQGITGFAFAVISVPVLSLFIGPAYAAGVGATIGGAVVVTGVIVHRSEIAWKGMMKLIAIALLFLPAGVLFVSAAPEAIVLATLGVVTIGVGASQLRESGSSVRLRSHEGATNGRPGHSPRRSRLLGVLAAAAAGTLGGAFATPGPPIVAYLYSQIEDRRRAKADLQFFFLVTSGLIIAGHAIGGNIPLDMLPAIAGAIPVAVVTTVTGIHLARRLHAARLRLITDWALILLGAVLIVRSALG